MKVKKFVEDICFEGQNFVETPLSKGQYEYCTFKNCVFSGADLSNFVFYECKWEGCNLAMANVRQTAFRTNRFHDCKLLGLRFDECNTIGFSVAFEKSILNYASFFKLKLKNALFVDCQLHEVEFIETDLTNVQFKNCDLYKTVFENSRLENADFRTASHFSIDPELNFIQKARFSSQNIVGLLHKYKLQMD